jgi:hypothetical protein
MTTHRNLKPHYAEAKGGRFRDENLVEGDPYAVELAQRTK